MKRAIKWALSLVAISIQSALGLYDLSNRENNISSTHLIGVGYLGVSPIDKQNHFLLAESVNGGSNWNLPPIAGAPEHGSLLSVSCFQNTAAEGCIAAGEDFTSNQPFIAQKRNTGNWSRVSMTELADPVSFSGLSCAAASSTDICVAAARTWLNGSNYGAIIQAINGSWGLPQLTNPLSSANCLPNSVNDIECFVGGDDVILHNKNGGGWETVFTVEFSFFDSISCMNQATGDIACTAVGGHTLAESSNETWSIITSRYQDYFTATSCIPTANICIAAGYDHTGTERSLLAQKIDGSWTYPIIAGLSGSLYAANCIDDGTQYGFCVAVGCKESTFSPVIVEWSNGNWSIPNITISNGGFNAVSCVLEGSSKKCVAAGFGFSKNEGNPLLIQRHDGGSWVPAPFNASALGQYFRSTAMAFSQVSARQSHRVGETLELT